MFCGRLLRSVGGIVRDRSCFDDGREMEMHDFETFQAALELKEPWFVAGSCFDAAARRLDLDISFASGARFTCPCCGAAACRVYGNRGKTPGEHRTKAGQSGFDGPKMADFRDGRSESGRMLHLLTRGFAPVTVVSPACRESSRLSASVTDRSHGFRMA